MKTRDHNSRYVGFYSDLLERIHLDMVSAILPLDEIARDSDELRSRARCEGMHFLTKVLPALGKSIDVSLASGTRLKVHGFKLAAGTQLPRFMFNLFSRVFRSDGVPWFATWHFDSSITFKGKEAWIQPNWAGSSIKVPVRVAESAMELSSSGVASCYLPGKEEAFPGLHTLDEVALSPKERMHISLGVDPKSGPLLSDEELNSRREAMVVALRAMRQVCFSLYKLELPYSDEQCKQVLADFVSADQELNFNVESLSSFHEIMLRRARGLICRVLANADPGSGIPRHGPGAVATGESQPEKHSFSRFYERLDAFFKYDRWFFCNINHVDATMTDSHGFMHRFKSLEYGTAKVVLVPKDSRGPRLISAEPLEYQWIQQALMRVLVDTIEHHRLTKGYVNFTDQEVNRSLALDASRHWSQVTLDLKEASDRVDLELVRALFPAEWFKALYASRTPETKLPDGTIMPMKKFAPMGSAVCFPVEALVFWALSVASLEVTYNLPQREAATKVYVYGDDIIVDAHYHGVISSALSTFGLKLNQNKCCVAGPFKESCGMDAFHGAPVTPLKVSATWCDTPEPSTIASYVEYSNEFYARGCTETAMFLEGAVQWVLSTHKMIPVPTVSGGEPSCIAFVREHERPLLKNRNLGCKIRLNRSNPKKPNYQVHEVQGLRLETKSIMTRSYGWPFLLRKLVELEAKNRGIHRTDDPGARSLPTGQYPIAHRVRLTRAWTPLR